VVQKPISFRTSQFHQILTAFQNYFLGILITLTLLVELGYKILLISQNRDARQSKIQRMEYKKAQLTQREAHDSLGI